MNNQEDMEAMEALFDFSSFPEHDEDSNTSSETTTTPPRKESDDTPITPPTLGHDTPHDTGTATPSTHDHEPHHAATHHASVAGGLDSSPTQVDDEAAIAPKDSSAITQQSIYTTDDETLLLSTSSTLDLAAAAIQTSDTGSESTTDRPASRHAHNINAVPIGPSATLLEIVAHLQVSEAVGEGLDTNNIINLTANDATTTKQSLKRKRSSSTTEDSSCRAPVSCAVGEGDATDGAMDESDHAMSATGPAPHQESDGLDDQQEVAQTAGDIVITAALPGGLPAMPSQASWGGVTMYLPVATHAPVATAAPPAAPIAAPTAIAAVLAPAAPAVMLAPVIPPALNATIPQVATHLGPTLNVEQATVIAIIISPLDFDGPDDLPMVKANENACIQLIMDAFNAPWLMQTPWRNCTPALQAAWDAWQIERCTWVSDHIIYRSQSDPNFLQACATLVMHAIYEAHEVTALRPSPGPRVIGSAGVNPSLKCSERVTAVITAISEIGQVREDVVTPTRLHEMVAHPACFASKKSANKKNNFLKKTK